MNIPIRREQLITTFGPGALMISTDGETALIGALDKWFHKEDGNRDSVDEFEIQEPRLKSILKVNKLLMPPDYRAAFQYQSMRNRVEQTNTELYIPLLRYPTWHYCQYCKTLHKLELTHSKGRADCIKCKKLQKMIQVPFVIVCENGHLSDFPWREWVHKDEKTICRGTMWIQSTGGTQLDSLTVMCTCNKKRSLRGIMSRMDKVKGSKEGKSISQLSQTLNADSQKIFHCPGTMPWYGSEEEKEQCSSFPIAVLKNSINVYYSKTISAIHLPENNNEVEELIDTFEKHGITYNFLSHFETLDQKIKFIQDYIPISDFQDEDIEQAIYFLKDGIDDNRSIDIEDPENELRKSEFKTLMKSVDSHNLKVRKEWKYNKKDANLKSFFSKLNRVTKLKETIALTGFSRLISDRENNKEYLHDKKLLFKNHTSPENNWLPAYKVFGEGIFFTLKSDKITKWEKRTEVISYFNKILTRMERSTLHIKSSLKSPRSVMIHTLAHIIIDELAITCGYNATSIRERLYLNNDENGILIYTSSGDIEGTFGGLVRMGREENFFPIIEQALDKATWCSSDPVCSEIGKSTGSGVNNLNGVACHSCVYLPETSCELGNLYLDRALLIDPEVGFF